MTAIVEKWNRHAVRKGGFGIRQDLFGIIDILALDRIKGVRGIQSTGTDFAGHMRKLRGPKREACVDWLKTPGTTLELWGWRQVKKGKGKVYASRVHVFTLDEFLEEVVELKSVEPWWVNNKLLE